ncbi:MAG: GNAT family N-acetyltransferase [Phycisphaerales bacterium]
MLFVRQATLDDLPVLKAFDEWKVVTDAKIQSGHCFVAGLDDRPLAFGILDHSFLHRPVISVLFVHPDHRRAGLGSALITHFESVTKEPKLWISTNIENLAMQGALHKHGYSLAGVINNLGAIPELFYFKVINPAS